MVDKPPAEERVTATIVRNAVVHGEGLTPACDQRRLFWADREAHEADVVAGFTALNSFRKRHLGTSPRPERCDPSVWAKEEASTARPARRADLS